MMSLGYGTGVVSRHVFNVSLHGVGTPPRPLEPGEEAVWLPVPALQAILDEAVHRRDLRITLDDGNRSDAQIVLEELGRRDLKATFFVVAGRLDRDDFLSTEDVEAILSAGHALGAHGMRHRPWRRLDEQALEEELRTARDLLEASSGRPITELACPFGSYDRRVLRRARELGYERVFTSDGGPADPHAWLQPRTTISSELSLSEIARPSRRDVLTRRAKRTIKRWR